MFRGPQNNNDRVPFFIRAGVICFFMHNTDETAQSRRVFHQGALSGIPRRGITHTDEVLQLARVFEGECAAIYAGIYSEQRRT
jgi:hypothetical protein